jgi:protein kinase-like protein
VVTDAARIVGRYEIVRTIGRGGMATVYLARQADLDREVALKQLELAERGDPELARRFLREARLASSFSHSNIVTVHDYFEDRGTPYIAMEYVSGGSLRQYVGHLSLPQIGGALGGVLAGLAHAAVHGIVHRDIKPENVMVTAEGSVKIADFGIAKATSVTQSINLTSTGTTLGTPRYMAPERAMGQEVGPWSDLYSVGVMAFELLVGHTPFSDTEIPMAILMRQINDPVPPVASLVPDVDRALSDWVERLLVKDPEHRTRSAAGAGDELDEILTRLLGPRWSRGAALAADVDGPAPRRAERAPPRPPQAKVALEPTLAPRTPPREERPAPARRTQRAVRTPVAAMAFIVVALVVLAAHAVRRASGGAPATLVGNSAVRLTAPPGWRKAALTHRLGLPLARPVAVAQSPRGTSGFIVAGALTSDAAPDGGLPRRLGLRGGGDGPTRVTLPGQRLAAWRYTGLRAEGLPGRVTLYVTPSGDGAAAVACVGPAEDTSGFAGTCDAVAGTLQLRVPTPAADQPTRQRSSDPNDDEPDEDEPDEDDNGD